MDGYFNQAQESLAFMVTDMNMQTAIDNYVSGTYKEQLDLRDFLRNRLANVSTVGRRTAAISIYIKEADRTYSRDFSDQPLSGIYGGEPWFEDLLAGKESFAQTEGISVQDQRPVWILASNIISVRNGGVLGLVYGPSGMALVFLVAAGFAMPVVLLYRRLLRNKQPTAIPFLPFLACGCSVATLAELFL